LPHDTPVGYSFNLSLFSSVLDTVNDTYSLAHGTTVEIAVWTTDSTPFSKALTPSISLSNGATFEC